MLILAPYVIAFMVTSRMVDLLEDVVPLRMVGTLEDVVPPCAVGPSVTWSGAEAC